MLRIRLCKREKFTPQWEGPIAGYAVNYLKRNFWKIQSLYSYEDAMQEAYCVFLRLLRKYENTVDSPQWFMALFKVSLHNQIINLAAQCTEHRHEVILDYSPSYQHDYEVGEDCLERYLGEENHTGELAVGLSKATDEIRQVLDIYLKAPAEFLQFCREVWSRSGKRKPFEEAHLRSLLGKPNDLELLSRTQKFLEELL